MKTNEILDHLFFINYELAFDKVDSYFEKLGFYNTAREESILSFIDYDSDDVNGISWYTMNIVANKILNSSFRTTKEINLDAIRDYAQTKYSFSYQQEVDDIIIYKKDNLRLHFRTSSFPTPKFSKMMYQITLFEPLTKQADLTMMTPSLQS